ncbi:hypothetical protein IW261DRAFT_1470516 [Armillaria novae-zelandiae]|uniref:Transmembrane protein n=1 Tax=Armillaria novae-zelandiae TaxID=153914 RepID=A0AA39UCC9_9AGAR|nr:hypothetical protein IW261DRAFT_1470516 [Armillaria novae-zelandiae]
MPSFSGAEYWVQARAEQNAYVACATLIVYEYCKDTVDFFWQRRWSLAKALFLWSRYYGVAFNVTCICNFKLAEDLNSVISTTFFYWQNTGASLQYAMYGNSCKILGLFVLLTALECLTMGLIFGLPGSGTIGTNEPVSGLFMCADADPPDHHWIVYYWVAVLVIESILLALALRQAWLHRSSASGSDLMRRLTRDSVIYFLVLFGIYFTNLIFWVRNRITLNEFGTAFAFVISSLFANRLVIAVRRAHYMSLFEQESQLSEVTTEIQFRREATGDADDDDAMELRNITRD